MPFVLDCSITMSWVFPDEATPATEALRDLLLEDQAVVPGLWPLEVANVLLVALRRGRIAESELPQLVAALEMLPIHVDPKTSEQVFSHTLRLAQAHNLSVYDAAYLELAQREGLPLATLDASLRSACEVAGVKSA